MWFGHTGGSPSSFSNFQPGEKERKNSLTRATEEPLDSGNDAAHRLGHRAVALRRVSVFFACESSLETEGAPVGFSDFPPPPTGSTAGFVRWRLELLFTLSLAKRTKFRIFWRVLLSKVSVHARGRFVSSVICLVDCTPGPVSKLTRCVLA